MGNLSDFTTESGADLVSALDAELGSSDWQGGGGGESGVTARYWRWTFNENTNWTGGVTVAEIEAFTDSAATGTDILTGGTASAERTSYSSNPNNAFDDNSGNFWGSDLDLQVAGTRETWIQYDLGSGNEAWVVEYTMSARSGVDSDQMASGWYMSYSLDGVNWIRVDDVSGETGWGSSETRTYVTDRTDTETENDRTYGWDSGNLVTPDYFIIDNMIAAREEGSNNIEHFAVSKTAMPATGMHYYEILVTRNTTDMQIGLVDPDSLGNADSVSGGSGLHDDGLVWREDGNVFRRASNTFNNWNTYTEGDLLRFVWDADNDRLYWGQTGSATKDIVIPGEEGTDYAVFTGLSGAPHIAAGIARNDGRAELRTRATEITEPIPAPAGILEPTADATPVNEVIGAIGENLGQGGWQTPPRTNPELIAGIDVELGTSWRRGHFNAYIDPDFLPTEYTIDSANARQATNTGGSTYSELFCVSTSPIPSSGQYYWEIHLKDGSVNNARFGLTDSGQRSDATSNTGGTEFAATHGIAISESNQRIIDGSTSFGSGAGAFTQNDIIAFAYDADTGEFWADVNAAPNTGGSALATKNNWPGDVHIAMNLRENNCRAEIVVNAADLTYTVPAGFTALGDGFLDESGGGTVDVVSNVATETILGRVTAGSGDSEELTPAQVRDLINVDETGIVPVTTLTTGVTDVATSNQGHMLEVVADSSSYSIIRIPDDATDNLPIGFTVNITVTADDPSYDPEVACLNLNVSLNGVAGGAAFLNGGVYTGATLYKSAANSWIIQGSHSAVA